MPTGTTEFFTLAFVLTAAGATVGGAFITGLIGLLKRLGGLGAWVDAGREPIVAFILSALLVAAAYASVLSTGAVASIEGVFAAILAWYGVASISMGTHEAVTYVSGQQG